MPAFSSDYFLATASRSTKLLFLAEVSDLPEIWKVKLRSLHIEHVSPGILVSQEICRRSPLGQSAELALQRGTLIPAETIVALMRRWFMARKPDAGFALTGFPATLLQVRILDEWLDARDESLDGVVISSFTPVDKDLVAYYRTHGLVLADQASGVVFRL